MAPGDSSPWLSEQVGQPPLRLVYSGLELRVGVPGREKRHNVWVLEAGREPDLALEALGTQHRGEFGPGNLENDAAREAGFFGEEHSAHTTTTQFPLDAVLRSQPGTQVVEQRVQRVLGPGVEGRYVAHSGETTPEGGVSPRESLTSYCSSARYDIQFVNDLGAGVLDLGRRFQSRGITSTRHQIGRAVWCRPARSYACQLRQFCSDHPRDTRRLEPWPFGRNNRSHPRRTWCPCH